MMYIDLHTHSTFSDGTLRPAALVDLAAETGLRAVALTDHDTVAGLDEALAQGRHRGVEVVPGVEISSRHGRFGLHLLGYFIQHRTSRLREGLLPLQAARRNRNEQIIQRLNQLGIAASMEELDSYSQGGQLGRPHIARLLVDKSVVRTEEQAFQRYLKKGGRAYVENVKLPAETAIRLIREAGGLAVLAHPAHGAPGLTALPGLLMELKELGLDGIEVLYPSHSTRTSATLRQLALRFELLRTGGSDFHGESRHARPLGGPRGSVQVDYALLAAMQERLADRCAAAIDSPVVTLSGK